MRNEYKKLQRKAVAEDNTVDKEIFDSLQLAVKKRNNSQYGVMLRLSAVVGCAITQYGREQNEIIASRAMQKYGMEVINADTDSAMVIDLDHALYRQPNDSPDDVGPMSRLSARFCPGKKSTPY